MTIKIEQAEGRVPQEELEFFLKGTVGLDHSRACGPVHPQRRRPRPPGAGFRPRVVMFQFQVDRSSLEMALG